MESNLTKPSFEEYCVHYLYQETEHLIFCGSHEQCVKYVASALVPTLKIDKVSTLEEWLNTPDDPEETYDDLPF